MVSSELVNGKQIVVLEFRGDQLIEPSSRSGRLAPPMLTDGTYELIVDGAVLGIDANGAAFGVAAVDDFFRLFGDSNGDGHVDSSDREDFMSFYTTGELNSIFDFDARPNKKAKDRTEFLKRLGTRI